MSGLNLFTAFFFGILAFLSPCTFPLIPSFLSFLLGISVKNLEDKVYTRQNRNQIIANISFYVLGSCLTLVLLGAVAGSAGYFMRSHRDILQQLGGVLVILFGIYILGLVKFSYFSKGYEMRPAIKRISTWHKNPNIRYLMSFSLGVVFTLGWIPCLSPILGAILILASSTSSVIYGSALLFIYSLGLNLPLIFLSVTLSIYAGYFKFLRKHITIVSRITGVLMVGLGVVILVGAFPAVIGFLYTIASRFY